MKCFDSILIRAGLRFADPLREDRFREYFVERYLWYMQAFLLGGAILSTLSTSWDETIDALHAPATREVKLLLFPFLLGPQTILLLRSVRRHAEKLVILPPLAALMAHLFFVAPALHDGLTFSTHPTMQSLLFFVACMRVRYLYVVLVTCASVAGFAIAHRLAPEHTPRLFDINIHFVLACGGVVLWAGFWHERLHRRQFETMGDLEAARAAAEQASQAKTRFLASASHDLRQPIHALGLHVHALKGWIRYPEVVVVLAQIESAVRAMEGMFNSLLDLTRLTSGAVKPEMASVPVIELQLELESMFGAPARDKGLDLRMHPCRLQVRSDPVLLRQILRNLVANAVRYTERGAVLVGCRRRGNALRIEVWDTGPGIGEDEQDAVFVEFVRLGRQGRKDDRGLGIGLTIAREAAQMLGHDLRVRSRIGRGSCFAIGVPLAEGAADVERARIDAVDSLRGAFVVVIEDDEEVLDAMRALLRSWGCHAILAVSAADARTQLARHQRIPDLIVCDYDLAGGETALDAVDGIREEDWPQVPVLVVTGTALASSAPEMARRGYPVMRKPIAPERLQQAMSRAMRSTG